MAGMDKPLNRIAEWTSANSRRWYPDPPGADPERWHIEHQAFGLAGELGEVVEYVKKWHRRNLSTAELRDCLASEIPDVLSYLLNLSHAIGLDLDAALEAKQLECEGRWGDGKFAWPSGLLHHCECSACTEAAKERGEHEV